MNYIVEANIAIGFLYGVYALLLRNETDFRKRRAFLVGSLLCGLLFPLIEISPVFDTPVTAIGMSTILLPEFSTSAPTVSSWSAKEIAMMIYFAMTLLIAAPLLFHAGRIYQTMKQAPGRYRDGYYVIESNENAPSWSFFKTIFIGRVNELSDEEKDLVMKHEMLHGKLLHSADMLLISLICIVFWFNPVVWLYRRAIAKVHEFEVDDLVANQNGAVGYCVLLAKTALSGNGFLLTHHFNQSFILKRINMINVIKNKISNWKLAMLVVAVGACFVAISCTEQASLKPAALSNTSQAPASVLEEFDRLRSTYPNSIFQMQEVDPAKPLDEVKDDQVILHFFAFPNNQKSWLITETRKSDEEVYTMVEESAQPHFGIKKYYENLGQVLQYPDDAAKKGIEGKVFVEFVIREDGKLSNLKVLKGLSEECDAEAMRAILQLGDWRPGTMHNKPVAQRMVLPIAFKLQ